MLQQCKSDTKLLQGDTGILSTATRNSTAFFNKRLVGLKAVTSHKLSCALNLQGRRTGGAAPELARPPGDFSRTALASLGTRLQQAREQRRHRRTFGHHLWETSRVWEESRQPRPHGGAAPSLRGLLHPAGYRFQARQRAERGPWAACAPAPAAPPGRAAAALRAGARSVPAAEPARPRRGLCRKRRLRQSGARCGHRGSLCRARQNGASPPGDRHRLGRPGTGSSGPRCRPTHLRRLRLGLAQPELPGLEARAPKG